MRRTRDYQIAPAFSRYSSQLSKLQQSSWAYQCVRVADCGEDRPLAVRVGAGRAERARIARIINSLAAKVQPALANYIAFRPSCRASYNEFGDLDDSRGHAAPRNGREHAKILASRKNPATTRCTGECPRGPVPATTPVSPRRRDNRAVGRRPPSAAPARCRLPPD